MTGGRSWRFTPFGYSQTVASLVIFSVNVKRTADFYEAVLGATPVIESSGDIRLMGNGEEVLIHSVPKVVAKDITISSPPAPRHNAAVKPIFDVTELETVLGAVLGAGGVVTENRFSSNGLTRHDVLDPDGNVIQLRGRASDG